MAFDSISQNIEMNVFYKNPVTIDTMKQDFFDIIHKLHKESLSKNIRYYIRFHINREEFPVMVLDSNTISKSEKTYLMKEAFKDDIELSFLPNEINDKTLNKYFNTRLIYKCREIILEAEDRTKSLFCKILDTIYMKLFCDIIK